MTKKNRDNTKNREKAKAEVQEVLVKYNCGIVMIPHLEADGIKITMDLIDNTKDDINKNDSKQ